MNAVLPKKSFIAILMLMVGLLALTPLPSFADRPAAKSNDPTVVYLTAAWCGTCRELYPAVKRAVDSADGGRYTLVVLDVDSPNAPSQAAAYGVTIAGSDLPQVYVYNGGRSKLLFSGQGYKFGKSKAVEEQIRQQL